MSLQQIGRLNWTGNSLFISVYLCGCEMGTGNVDDILRNWLVFFIVNLMVFLQAL